MTSNGKFKKAVVLLSGGLDSATTMVFAKSLGFELFPLTVDYNQRHKIEIEKARKLAIAFQAVEHKIISLDLRKFGGAALTDSIEVPKLRPESEINTKIPLTYVPARNLIFLSIALSWAESLEARDIFIGVNSIDYSNYPDCRPQFINAFQIVADLGTKKGIEGNSIKINAPLINMNKKEIILLGKKYCLDFSLTHSCYDPDSDGVACGGCDSCQLRKKGFREAGMIDPIKYN